MPRARQLCERAAERFALSMGRMHERPVGPHPDWSCQLAFAPELLAEVLPWLLLNRDDLADHRDHALWIVPGRPRRQRLRRAGAGADRRPGVPALHSLARPATPDAGRFLAGRSAAVRHHLPVPVPQLPGAHGARGTAVHRAHADLRDPARRCPGAALQPLGHARGTGRRGRRGDHSLRQARRRLPARLHPAAGGQRHLRRRPGAVPSPAFALSAGAAAAPLLRPLLPRRAGAGAAVLPAVRQPGQTAAHLRAMGCAALDGPVCHGPGPVLVGQGQHAGGCRHAGDHERAARAGRSAGQSADLEPRLRPAAPGRRRRCDPGRHVAEPARAARGPNWRLVQHALQDGVDDAGGDGDQHHVAADSAPFVAVVARQAMQGAFVQALAVAMWQRLALADMHVGRHARAATDLRATIMEGALHLAEVLRRCLVVAVRWALGRRLLLRPLLLLGSALPRLLLLRSLLLLLGRALLFVPTTLLLVLFVTLLRRGMGIEQAAAADQEQAQQGEGGMWLFHRGDPRGTAGGWAPGGASCLFSPRAWRRNPR
ncbi:UNVERIFIED_CONTAM: hypothetical protein NCL1_59199 [Trichonephila clavipes]